MLSSSTAGAPAASASSSWPRSSTSTTRPWAWPMAPRTALDGLAHAARRPDVVVLDHGGVEQAEAVRHAAAVDDGRLLEGAQSRRRLARRRDARLGAGRSRRRTAPSASRRRERRQRKLSAVRSRARIGRGGAVEARRATSPAANALAVAALEASRRAPRRRASPPPRRRTQPESTPASRATTDARDVLAVNTAPVRSP